MTLGFFAAGCPAVISPLGLSAGLGLAQSLVGAGIGSATVDSSVFVVVDKPLRGGIARSFDVGIEAVVAGKFLGLASLVFAHDSGLAMTMDASFCECECCSLVEILLATVW